MPTACGLILIKRFSYRGNADEEWSSRYWLTGGIPVDDAAWLALANEIAGHEKTCYSADSSIVRAYGYNDSGPAGYAVWVYDYVLQAAPIPGTLVGLTNEDPMAGDQAGMVWWRTARRNARGKWVYLRKFFHGGFSEAGDRDSLGLSTTQAYTTFGLAMSNGSLANGRVIRSGLQDEVITRTEPHPWTTTRTLKRRGKRPVPGTP